MEEKINIDYSYFKTSEGKFFLLNTDQKDDKIELINDVIYIKRNGKQFESAIAVDNGEKFQYLGQLFKIDHLDIFEKIFRFSLVEYQKDMTYLWRSLDALLNSQNITILSDNNDYRQFYNPHIFKVRKIKN